MVGTDQTEAAIKALHETVRTNKAAAFKAAGFGALATKMRPVLEALGVTLKKGTNGTGGGNLNTTGVINGIRAIDVSVEAQKGHMKSLGLKNADINEAANMRTEMDGRENRNKLDLQMAYCALVLCQDASVAEDDEALEVPDEAESDEMEIPDDDDMDLGLDESAEEVLDEWEQLLVRGGAIWTNGTMLTVGATRQAVNTQKGLRLKALGKDAKGKQIATVDGVNIRGAGLREGYDVEEEEANVGQLLFGLVMRSAVADEKCPIDKATYLDKVARSKLKDVDYEEVILQAVDDGQVEFIAHPKDGGYIKTEALIKHCVKASKSLDLLPWSVLIKPVSETQKKESKTLSMKASEEYLKRRL